MDHSIHQSTPAPKEPPKLTRGLFQGPPLPNTRYPSAKPATKVLKIGDKELTFHMHPLRESESQQQQGAARGRGGLGRGAAPVGKGELPFSRLERMQNSCALTQDAIERSDWLGESGAESMPIATDLEESRNESDWLSEKEGMNSNSELEPDTEHIPTFQAANPVTKESSEKPLLGDKILYILRGCPGSGKSTLARELKGEEGQVFSTDEYFVRLDGEYVFDPKKVAVYHKRNHEKAREAISEGVSPVVIDNTNTTAWEMRPYVETGFRHGYRVQFVEPDTPWRYDPEQLTLRNSHGVPLESIKRMLKRFQKHPTVENVLGKSAFQRIIEETDRREDSYPELEDELSSNQDTLNSSTDECRSAGSSPARDKPSIPDAAPIPPPAEVPDRYSIILEPEPTESVDPVCDSETPLIGPRNASLVSNQERFNQQLVQELTSSSRVPSLFCLNLQSLAVLQDILNIDKTLLGQNNFPLAQLLLPPHVISQLSHTQVANFQHNYQRYLQHIMQRRSQETRPFIPKANFVPTPRDQSIYSQARMQSQIPPVFSHQRMNHRLPAQIPEQFPFAPAPGGNRFPHKPSNPELKPEPKLFPINNGDLVTNQCCNLADPLTNEKIHFPSNQGMQLNSKIEFDASKQTPNEPIKFPDDIPVENNSFFNSFSKDTKQQQQQQQQQQISLQQTNNKEIQLRDEIFPNITNTSTPINQLIVPNETSYKLESNDDVTGGSSEISPTLSPSDRSFSTSETLENSSVSLEKLTPNKPYTDTLAMNTDNGETSHILPTDNIPDSDCFKLTDDQNTILKPSLLLEGLANQSELLTASGKGADEPSGTETKCLATTEPAAMNEQVIETSYTPIQLQPDTLKRFLSEKIDWGDSSDSDKCVTSPIHSPNVTGERANDRAAPGGLIASWDTWGGWSSNFISHNSVTHPGTVVSKNSSEETTKKPNFDPTIQPPRKHSSASLKSANESLEFTPSFSRFKSLDSDPHIRSPRKLCGPGDPTPVSRPRWSHENNKVSLLPGGAEWQWKVSSFGLARNNENSEGSSPRSDTDDPRNSKPLNPFAVPWKPFLPSSSPQGDTSDLTEKLGHLKGFFPTLSFRELQKFLSECDSNIDRTVEAIIEQAEAYNLDLPMSSQVPVPNKMAKKLRSPNKSEKVTTPLDATAPEFRTVLIDDTIDSKWQQNNATFHTSTPPVSAPTWPEPSRPNDTYNFKQMNDSSSIAATNQSALSFADGSNTASPLKQPYTPLVLELDSNLASQLVKQFGPLPGCTKEGSLDLSRISLTADTALLLHQLWCKSVQTYPPADSYYVSPGQGAPWLPPEDPIQQAKSQLYNLYPGIDTQALDEVLSDKNFSISAANEYITTALSTAQKANNDSLTPSFALITQRGSHSFPPLPTKSTRNYSQISSSQNTKTIF